MFLPPKLTTIIFHSMITGFLLVNVANAQQSDFNRRMEAMQQARSRVYQPANGDVRTVSNETEVDYTPPPQPVRVAQSPVQSLNARSPRVVLGQTGSAHAAQNTRYMQTGSRVQTRPAPRASNGYVPDHLRTAQILDEPFIDGGSPIVGSQVIGSQMVGSPVGCASCGDAYGGELIDGGCASCGDTAGYFDDQCCDRGGCPPGPCWITGLGIALYNGEYFGGATSFRSSLFPTPGTANNNQLANDCSSGFYGGVNFGIPLCKLTCGVFSGQLGIRTVQTNFDGNEFSAENRNQIFVTGGFYRRVDYGLQMGVVADVLHEEWFAESDLVQIRGDVGWVYAGGSTLGFRYATNVQDDLTTGTFAGNGFANFLQTTEDNYRFYYRMDSPTGGFGEAFLGWSDSNQTILGLDFDLPIADRLAMQAGFAYYLNDDGVPQGSNQLGGNQSEAYNIFVGLSFRPRGRSFYQSYDRPLFSVADNGTMMISRQ